MLTVKYSKTLFERDETTLTNIRIYMFFLRAIIIGIFFSTSSKITAGEDILIFDLKFGCSKIFRV